MKTKYRNFVSMIAEIVLFSILFFSLFMLGGCNKDDNSPSSKKKAYTDMRDDSTTRIIATIPRIELSKFKSTLIKLYLSVTDQDGKAFTDFNQYNFTIKQVCVGSIDTTLVAELSFEKLNTSGENIITPLTLDYSGSMDGYTINMESAVNNFISIKQPNDMVELIKFSEYPQVVQPFTSDTSILVSSLFNYWPGAGSGTAFYDAVGIGINDADTYINQTMQSYLPAIIGFTDGMDNASYYYYNISDLISLSLLKQIPIYTLGFGDADSLSLKYLSNNTGGRYYYAPDITNLSDLYSLISGQLKNVYMVSWNYNDDACNDVLLIVEASYICKNGNFHTKVEKYFQPIQK